MPRARPAPIARQASAASWQVKALVDATPISGPASVGITTSLSRAIVEVGHVDDREDVLLLLLGVAQRRERVGGLARLRDEQRKAVRLERRLAIAEFGRDIDLDRQAARNARTSISRPGRRNTPCRRPRSRCARSCGNRTAAPAGARAPPPCRGSARACGRRPRAARGFPSP